MYFDLNVVVPVPAITRPTGTAQQSKKGKGKAPQNQDAVLVSFSPGQIAALEARIDLLVHLGYSVLALAQVVYKRVDPKTHSNVLDGLLAQLRKRDGVAFLKRLTIVLDEDSEKGFGLVRLPYFFVASLTVRTYRLPATLPFASYDLLALVPTTAATFSLACLTHTQPSPLTTHIIALPLTLPRLPFHLKHTLVRSVLKNGCIFEISYAGALGETPPTDLGGGAESGGAGTKRNWWAGAREVVRVTKGKSLVVSGGVSNSVNLRAPRDIGNLFALTGLAQDAAHEASTKTCKAIVLRAQTRRTYRAVLSEPTIIFPSSAGDEGSESKPPTHRPDVVPVADLSASHVSNTVLEPSDSAEGQPSSSPTSLPRISNGVSTQVVQLTTEVVLDSETPLLSDDAPQARKRAREQDGTAPALEGKTGSPAAKQRVEGEGKKKKRKKSQQQIQGRS